MSREIKFRGWDGEEMYEFGLSNIDAGSIPVKDSSPKSEGSWAAINSLEIMRFSGLKDRNGKGNEVYESDLFKVIFKDCPDGYKILGRETTVIEIIGKVIFQNGMFAIEFKHPETNQLTYSPLFDFLKNPEKEVIGNIHQNPELIK